MVGARSEAARQSPELTMASCGIRASSRAKIARYCSWRSQLEASHDAFPHLITASPLLLASRRRAVVEGAGRLPALSVEVGRRGPARRRQSHEARNGAAGHAPDTHRRGLRARARAPVRHAVLGGPALPDGNEAHDHECRVEPPRQQRRGRVHRDRPGRHAVRRVHASDNRRQPVQLRQGRRRGHANGLHQARHRARRNAHHARGADRRRGAQGRRDAGRTRMPSPPAICSRRCNGRS